MKTLFVRLERRFTGDYRFRQLEMEDAALCWRFVRLAEAVQTQNDQGRLENLDGSPITPEQLSLNEGCKPEAVQGYRRCLERCLQLGLLELSGDIYCIPQWDQLWSCTKRGRYPSDEPERVRQRVSSHRNDKQKNETTSLNGNESRKNVTRTKEYVTVSENSVTTSNEREESVTSCNECNESLHPVTSHIIDHNRIEYKTDTPTESIVSQQPDGRVGLAVGRFEKLGYLLSSAQLEELRRLVRGSPIGLDAVARVFDEHQDAIFEQRRLPSANRSIKRPVEFLFAKFREAKLQLEEAAKVKLSRETSEREELLVRAVSQLRTEVARAESILADPATGDEMRALVSRELKANRVALQDKEAKLAAWRAA